MDSATILVVEDNADELELMLRAMRKCRIPNEVIVARDGVEAMDALFGGKEGHRPRLPQLVLLDLKLPRIDGLELLSRIRGNPETRLLPVVVLTSSREQADVIDSYSLGANSYVQKPVDFDRFVEVLQELAAYWLSLNEPPPSGRSR